MKFRGPLIQSLSVYLFLAIWLAPQHSAFAAFTPPPDTANFELEVAVCPEGILSFTQFEYPSLKGKPFAADASDFRASFSSPLAAFSPARADALARFEAEAWSSLQKLSGTQLIPRIPTTALFHRADCAVKTLAAFAVNRMGRVSGRLDQDLWLKIDLATRNILIAESYFYFESSFWLLKTTFDVPDWNPTQSRYFLTEWLSPNRPQTLRDFFKLARDSDLVFVEQSGIFVPLPPNTPGEPQPTWSSATGLVSVSPQEYELANTPWKSGITIGGSSLAYNGWNGNSKRAVLFYEDGSIHCLGLSKSILDPRIGPYVRSQPQFPNARWTSPESYWDDDSRLCVYPDGSIERAYLAVPWRTPATWTFAGSIMTIDADPLAGGRDQGTTISFFSDGTIREIKDSWGTVALQGKKTLVRGPLTFEKVMRGGVQVNRLACAQVPENSKWLDSKGATITAKVGQRVLCFDENDRVSSSR